jgi:hypothetical protein
MKKYLFLVCVLSLSITYAQTETESKDSLMSYQGEVVEVRTKAFMNEYNRLKPIVLKVYPYALSSADILDEMNNELEKISKRRKRTSFCKRSYKNLKEEFKYVFMDMYTIEGQVLTKLVARETGMPIFEIIKKYRGTKDAAMFSLMGKMFDQNIKDEYDYEKEKVLEAIIKDIEKGVINFDHTVHKLDKTTFKKNKKDNKKSIKTSRKRSKARKKSKQKKLRQSKMN